MLAEVSLEFMTGNPQLGVLSGRLTYFLQNDTGAGRNSAKQPSDDNINQDENDDCAACDEEGRDNDTVSPAHAATCNASAQQQLPERRSTLLCVLSVPAHMIPTDMLQFVAPFKKKVHFVRILRPCNPVGPSDPDRTPAEYMVLLQMESQDSADDLFLQCNGKRFNSFEEARCRVVFVATATFDLREAATVSTATSTTHQVTTGAAPGTSPTVAAPAFDTSSSSSTKHMPEAKQPYEAASSPAYIGAVDPPASPLHPASAAMRFAPMARAGSGGVGTGAGGAFGVGNVGVGVAGPGEVGISQGEAAAASATVVAAAEWSYDASTCVICMDRMESHVLTTVCNHTFHVECLVKWQDSPCPVCRFHHNNASEASTCQKCQASDNLWVCLICGSVLCGSRHDDDVRSHYTATLHAYALEIETQQVWDFAGDGFVHRLIHNKADGKLVEIPDPGQTSEERPQVPARLSDVQEERLVHGKLEGLAYQYNTLLTSQLDEQRHCYEKQLNDLLEHQEKDRRDRREKIVSGADLISALRQERRELESKCASASDRLKKVREETAFLWELNKSLEANKEQWSASLDQAQRDLDAAKNAREQWVPQLEAKVAQLMLKLDAAATGCGSCGTGELETEGSGGGGTRSTGSAGSISSGSFSGGGTAGNGGVGGPASVDEAKAAEAEEKAVGMETRLEGQRAFEGGDRKGEGGDRRESVGASASAGQQQGHSGGGSGKKKGRRKKGK